MHCGCEQNVGSVLGQEKTKAHRFQVSFKTKLTNLLNVTFKIANRLVLIGRSILQPVKEINPQKIEICQIAGERVEADFVT